MSGHARKGMTLLEVVVALTVAGAALAAGALVLGFLTDQQDRTGVQEIASANAVRTMMRDWTSAARLTTEGDAEFRGARVRRLGEVAQPGMRDDAELIFVTTAPTRVAPSGGEAGTRVHIYMERNETALVKGLVAELTPWRRSGEPVVVSLAPEAAGFEARYLGSLFGRRSWQDSWVSASVLPAAVELRVLYDTTRVAPSDDRAAHALLALPMSISLGGRR